MKVLILTHGSRGDVQPFAALARALRAAGHHVVIGLPDSMTTLVETRGVDVVRFSDIAAKLVNYPEFQEMAESNFRGLRGKKTALALRPKYVGIIAEALDDLAKAGQQGAGADLVVHNVSLPGHEVAELLGVPALPVGLQPFWVPTRAFPEGRFPCRVPSLMNRATYIWARVMLAYYEGSSVRDWRNETLRLPYRWNHRNYLRGRGGPAVGMLHGFSRHVLPRQLDYPPWVHTTGFWTLPAGSGWSPPQSLSEFLSAGEPPVYIGFGSNIGPNAARTGVVVAEAVRRAKVRAVVATGWGAITAGARDDQLYYVDQVPHDWLLPQMAAVVHQCGGTISAAVVAGRPQVVCPFGFSDMPYYASRMHALGVAPPPLPQRSLTAADLGDAISRAVSDRDMAARAQELGRLSRAEGGAAAAVDVIETIT
ncbi:glycosyltransferase [Amycolatopsis thermoflava]|uniref:Sterol 3beta-glucosyltransferase n=1 Tax=Amycolatopsis thermoflava TaxID=84480 RepID=A0A3N2GYW9_9PSEU|nr:glycosyltransferase [Amycolatopsis thermoflava]ROS41420.1 sterol 3beta-glucosyltransferase [Amycolatopsis thermoflava]